MGSMKIKRFIKRFLLWTFSILIFVYILLFGLVPLVFRYSYGFQTSLLFVNFVNLPAGDAVSKPEVVGLTGARNFYFTTDDDVKIGAWQILPQSLLNQSIPQSQKAYETVLKNSNRPVFLYMHGNGGNRASSHRVAIYKLFQRLDFHVICFDYRNYGDSDNAKLSETAVVNDGKFVLEWLIKTVDNSAPIFVWGHSLGTGVASHVLALLTSEGVSPAGLFLEAPFNNLANLMEEYPLSKIFKHLPWFHWAIVQPLYDNGLRFESDKHIKNIQCPVMILCAEDDELVPFYLVEKLYIAGQASHPDNKKQIQMTKISSSYGFGHMNIYRYKALPRIIENFVNQSSTIKST